MADLAVNPSVNAAIVVQGFGKGCIGKLEIRETLESVMKIVSKVRKGNMTGPEAILVAQVSALNSIFTELARRAGANMGEFMDAMESYLRLALKAQARCRATIETLADMKNPPVVIARQANIANGPQQVNNGQPPRAEKSETSPNELLEQEHSPRLDAGATNAAVAGNTAIRQYGNGRRGSAVAGLKLMTARRDQAAMLSRVHGGRNCAQT